MSIIRLGHDGTMHDHSWQKLACVKKFPETYEVVGIVAESDERQKEIENNAPYAGTPFMTREALYEKGVDAVLIERCELDLVKTATWWVERGVSVHVDKPAGASVEDLERLYALAKEKGVAVQIAYMYRYNAAYLDCLARIEKGELGAVYQVDAQMNTRHDNKKRDWLNQFPGGIMFFLGCHMVDMVYRIKGEPKAVYPFVRHTGMNGVDAPDQATAILDYGNSYCRVEATSCEVNGYGRRQLVVCGTKGTYEIVPLENPTHAYFIPFEKSKTYGDCRVEVDLPPYDPDCRYDGMMLDFAAFVRGDKENPYGADYEIGLEKLLLRCCGEQA